MSWVGLILPLSLCLFQMNSSIHSRVWTSFFSDHKKALLLILMNWAATNKLIVSHDFDMVNLPCLPPGKKNSEHFVLPIGKFLPILIQNL